MPNLKLRFDEDFYLCHYDANFLQNMAIHFFQNLYYCGDRVRFVNNNDSIPIVNTDGTNRFENEKVHIRKSITNPLIFLHEIVHAILDNIADSYHTHNESLSPPCNLLDIYTDSAPGYQLDIVNRLEMHFTASELGDNINHGVYYLPDIGYPSLEEFCRNGGCLLYTSPSPRDQRGSRMPSSA